MPRGRPKLDLSDLKDRLVALILHHSKPSTALTDEEIARALGAEPSHVKKALSETVKEGRVKRHLNKNRLTGTHRVLHVHAPRQKPPDSPPRPTGFGRPVYTCVVCGERLVD